MGDPGRRHRSPARRPGATQLYLRRLAAGEARNLPAPRRGQAQTTTAKDISRRNLILTHMGRCPPGPPTPPGQAPGGWLRRAFGGSPEGSALWWGPGARPWASFLRPIALWFDPHRSVPAGNALCCRDGQVLRHHAGRDRWRRIAAERRGPRGDLVRLAGRA